MLLSDNVCNFEVHLGIKVFSFPSVVSYYSLEMGLLSISYYI